MIVNTEKIKLNKFGLNKTVSVRMTMGQFDKMNELGINLLEHDKFMLENSEDMEALESMIEERKIKNLMIGFVQDMFSLSDEEIETILDSINNAQFKEAFSYITDRLRGVTDKEYQLAVKQEKILREKEEQEDPKDISAESAD
ncbi:phage tail assembly chaperone [Leuconostoc gasicomitatum]|uniref:phage tail assembly chaperone n=1 Tax=Leuconostoc gasicomitatum TaxID=115778 RepID=UPI001CC50564|nr:phage tail assembly chaperone [Leuconostoc gasicomitatum]MBZ5958138.1 molecular chaperone [Leuconostoc gasicomitatum]